MKLRTKSTTIAMAVLFGAMGLSGCGGDSTPTDDAQDTPVQTETTPPQQ